RDGHVTGVQTCALPISRSRFVKQKVVRHRASHDMRPSATPAVTGLPNLELPAANALINLAPPIQCVVKDQRGKSGTDKACRGDEIGRASCRERVWIWEG